jgi:uracil-DNA glycosylase
LLNSSLTEEKLPNSHASSWSWFSDKIIKKISDEKENIIFVLWGAFAAKKSNLIDHKKHKIIITSHPSGLSCNKPYQGNTFINYDHFGEINKYLEKHNLEKIIWQIT